MTVPSPRRASLQCANFQARRAPRPCNSFLRRHLSGEAPRSARLRDSLALALDTDQTSNYPTVPGTRQRTIPKRTTHAQRPVTFVRVQFTAHRKLSRSSTLSAQRAPQCPVRTRTVLPRIHCRRVPAAITQVTEVQNAVDAAVELALAGIALLALTVPKQLFTPSGQTCSSWAPCPCGPRRASPRRTRRR